MNEYLGATISTERSTSAPGATLPTRTALGAPRRSPPTKDNAVCSDHGAEPSLRILQILRNFWAGATTLPERSMVTCWTKRALVAVPWNLPLLRC